MTAWDAPFDTERSTSGVVKLAKRIAGHVALWRSQGRLAKDVLILVRRRGVLFESIIRALKNRGVPVAGADRLVLTEHIAVMDLMALADALLLPQDDLALATVLKSPLFGLDDDELFKLAWERKASLRRVLRAQRPDLSAQLDALREKSRTMTPFAFYADLLGAAERAAKAAGAARPRGGRRARRVPQPGARLRAHRDAVAAGLRRLAALGAGRGEARHGNGARRGAGDDGARRQGTGGADRHPGRHHDAAAGLPSAEAAATAGRRRGPPPLVWATAKANDVGPMEAARESALGEARDEYRRLLYVAMTRAIERLIVCGVDGINEAAGGLLVRSRARRARRRTASVSRPTTATARCCAIARSPDGAAGEARQGTGAGACAVAAVADAKDRGGTCERANPAVGLRRRPRSAGPARPARGAAARHPARQHSCIG